MMRRKQVHDDLHEEEGEPADDESADNDGHGAGNLFLLYRIERPATWAYIKSGGLQRDVAYLLADQ